MAESGENTPRNINTPTRQVSSAGRFLLWVLSALLAILAWIFARLSLAADQLSFVQLFVLGLLHILLTLTLARSLINDKSSARSGYRQAFLLSFGLAFLQCVEVWLVGLLGRLFLGAFSGFAPRLLLNSLAVLGAAWLGAFLGGLVFTAWLDGLWEDNAPPPRQIQEEVHDSHARIIGTKKSTPWLKRLFDLAVSATGLLFSAPVWLLSFFVIWFEDPGPLLFVKNSVGKDGRNFHQFKLRTMVLGAEEATGPVLAQEGDTRILPFGRFLRKTALDELPQLINIMLGEMSFVGPRPQRTVLVCEYLQQNPRYALRHQVPPGLAGLAQVAGDYYLTPQQKLRFDLLYIQHMSLGYDLRLLFAAFLLTFWYRWQKGWDGRLPRKLLH